MRMYGDLASWWPLISPVGDYAGEATYAAGLLGSASIPVREVLELGSGGGHNAWHLGSMFAMTLVDVSPDMLAVSRVLNPGADHVVGDMRAVRLGRVFDAVLVHDAVDYMTTTDDLQRLFDTVFVHCRPGGVAVFMPDHVAETFEPGTLHGGSDAADGRGVRYLEWRWDPDPADTWILAAFAFLLRSADGSVEAASDLHRTGLFEVGTWLELLGDAGFRPDQVIEETSEDRTPRRVFLGHRPG